MVKEICRIRHEWIEDIVEIHISSFPNFFLTFLGPNFLRIFYNRFVKDSRGICFAYLENGKIMGFVVGNIDPPKFYANLLKYDWFKLGVAAIPALLKRPKSFFRILNNTQRAYKGMPNASFIVELSSIAVLPSFQGKGIGKQLVSAFIKEAAIREAKIVYLTTDAENNDVTNSFYKNLGFRIKRVYKTREGRIMNEYWYKL